MVHPYKLLLLTVGALLLLALPTTGRAQGWKLVSGRVQKIEPQGDLIRLTLKADYPGKEGASQTLELPAKSCPGSLAEGNHIRIWSKPAGSGKWLYKISANRRFDSTGVRLRLRKHGHRAGGRRGGKGGHGGH